LTDKIKQNEEEDLKKTSEMKVQKQEKMESRMNRTK
jgi:hypothetical protein